MNIIFMCLISINVWLCKTQESPPLDAVAPVVTNCPDSFEITAASSQPSVYATWDEPTVADNSGHYYQIYRSYRPNSLLPVGENEVVYVFADESDNRATCSFTVNVIAFDSNPPIVYNCPEDIYVTVEMGTDSEIVVEWTEPAAMDDSGVAVLYERTHWPGQLFSMSSKKQMVRYIYRDSSLNEGYCTFNVVLQLEDSTKPQILHCPNIVSREVELHSNGSYVEWMNPTATDNSGTVNIMSMSHGRGEFFPIGITKVEYIFSDEAGNSATCNIDVVVTEVDRMVPKILHCPSDIVAGLKAPSTTTTVEWTEPTASDNSGRALMTGRSHVPGSEFQLDMSVEVIYQFSDQSGNTAYCSFDVMVITDTTKPTIIGCPTRIIRQVNRSEKGMRVVWEEPIAIDDTATVAKMFNTHTSGDFFYVGSTGVEYVFKDLAGNTEECSFEIQITYVAEAVNSNTRSQGSSGSSGMDAISINRMVMVIPITIGAIIVLTSLIVVIGVYLVKRINYKRNKDKNTATPDEEVAKVNEERPYFVLNPDEYTELKRNDQYIEPSKSSNTRTIPLKLAMVNQAGSTKGSLGDVWTDNWKYRGNGPINRSKSRKPQVALPSSVIEDSDGDKSYITMRKAKSKKILSTDKESGVEQHRPTSSYMDGEQSTASESYIDMTSQIDSIEEYQRLSDVEDSPME